MKEGMNTEFKEVDREKGTLPVSISKEIVAFANTEGGDIYIGIRDDGTVVGVKDSDDTMKRVSSVAHDTILPNIMPFIRVEPIEMGGKDVIKTSVSVGTERPYYLAKEGLTPKGVYVRIGSSCIPLGEAGIREMIMETSGKAWEACRSINQDLTFDTLQSVLAQRNIGFGEAQKRTMKLLGSDGLYTNLALLLSDQCAHTTKVAVFQGKGNAAVFRDRCEFSGSLLKQLEEAYQFLDRYNSTKATFSGLWRMDTRDYPKDALREAFLNSLIHRDYLFSGSTIINMFDDRVEFISLGGLIRGISMETAMNGVSQSRNPNLQAVFYRLNLVESYGTGIRKIIALYNGFSPQPDFWSAEGGFKVTLYNQNENEEDPSPYDGSLVRESYSTYGPKEEDSASSTYASIYELAVEKGEVSRKEIDDKFGFSTTKSFKLLKKMCESGLLQQKKCGYQTVYVPKAKK